MFGEFLKLELRSAFKSPMIYVFVFIVALFAFGAVASDTVQIGGAIGNIYRNSPHSLTNFTLILGLIGLLFAAAFFNNAALRDHNNQFNEILFSTPLKKSGYFWGRFLGALILSSIPLLGVWIGAWIGSIVGPLAGWITEDQIGPFYAKTLINNYLIFILPNMFLGGAVIFFLAHRFKNTIISFVGAMAIIVAYIASGTLLSDIDNESLAALTDIFGLRTYSVFTRYYTPIEKNTLSLMFSGLILQNRLIWLGAAILISVLSYASFSFQEKARFRFRKRKKKVSTAKEENLITSLPAYNLKFNRSLAWKQFASFYKTNTISITGSVVFKILAFFGILLLFINLLQGYEYFGLQSYPVTYKVIGDITSSTAIFMTIIVIFFSGELVWRDRVAKIDEVINATPHNSFISIFAKVLSLITIASLLYFTFMGMGIISQLVRGYTRIEVDVYLVDFFLGTLPEYFIFAALFIFIQTLVNNRYIGYFIGLLFVFAWSIIAGAFYWESNMLLPGASPGIFYSDISGYGPGLTGTLWFNLYWGLFALLLIMLAGILWPRSVVKGLKEKIQVARANFSKKTGLALGTVFAIWFLVGVFVYFNTQVLNPYKDSKERELISVDYERKYKKYQNMPLPIVTDVDYNIDIFPNERDVYVNANVDLINNKAVSIDSLFFNYDQSWTVNLQIDDAELVLNDEELGVMIFELKTPLNPGEKLNIVAETSYVTKGFKNSLGNTSILSNGTFLNNFSILPSLGYAENVELSDKNDRKKYDLPPKNRTPELADPCGELCMANYLTDGLADWVNVETVISTSEDQIAVAPGSLIKEWTEDGRRYFHYKVDHPSQNFYSFMSARYDVHREKYKDVDIEIYHDPKHSVNVQMMADAVRKSLEYYEEHFGPYFHKQARIIEFPRYANFAQAFPGTMPYSESFGWIVNLEDENENNVIDAVVAHEMAHQWWAHQEIPAKMQGGTMLTESFSEYSSLMVMKQNADDMKMKNFLKYDFNRYLRGRAFEREKELPLYKVENQGYIHYGKGAVILYALQDYIGTDSVNAALQDFLEAYRYREPPYPRSIDFLEFLEPKVPDSLNYLVDDWFRKITLYDLRMESATAEKLDDGKYEVTMEIKARKLYADSLGNEEQTELKEWIDVGVYADSDEEELLNWKRVQFNNELSTVKLIVDTIPKKAAVDPRRMLIERVTKDNVKTIDL